MDLFSYYWFNILYCFGWRDDQEVVKMTNLRQFFVGFKVGSQDFGHTIALIVNSILLFIVYCIGVGITSIVARLFGKHFLETKRLKKRKTYWSDLNLKRNPIEYYYRQF